MTRPAGSVPSCQSLVDQLQDGLVLTQHGDLKFARGCGRGLPLHRRDLRKQTGCEGCHADEDGAGRTPKWGCGRSRAQEVPTAV